MSFRQGGIMYVTDEGWELSQGKKTALKDLTLDFTSLKAQQKLWINLSNRVRTFTALTTPTLFRMKNSHDSLKPVA